MDPTPDIWDANPDALDSCDLQLRSFGGRTSFTGPVRTVRCVEDNLLVKELLATDGAGAVLVVDGGGSMHSALVGDRIAASAAAHGWAGVIVNGVIRDSAAMSTIDLGVKAIGTNPRRSAKTGDGAVDITVSFGGATFVPGAALWADADGVLVERR